MRHMKLAFLLSGTSAYSIAYTNVGATTRGVFKAYVGFFFRFSFVCPILHNFISLLLVNFVCYVCR